MQSFRKKILICLSGMSPQVITETVYALKKEQGFIPTALQVITTMQGKEQIMNTLLGGPHYFKQLCTDYHITAPIDFTEKNIHIITDKSGLPLDDIKTPEQNESAANIITRVIYEACCDEDAQVHVSIAGGRKTMGFFAGYALSLFARAQDSLSHVLVPPEVESRPDFFYPPPASHLLTLKNGQIFDASSAHVILALIPFVKFKMADLTVLMKNTSYAEAVLSAQNALRPARISIDCAKRHLLIHDHKILLPPVAFAFYAWMAQRAKEGKGYIKMRAEDRGDIDTFVAFYAACVPNTSDKPESSRKVILAELSEMHTFSGYFRHHISKIKNRLETVLGANQAKHYSIDTKGPKGGQSFGLSILPDSIHFL